MQFRGALGRDVQRSHHEEKRESERDQRENLFDTLLARKRPFVIVHRCVLFRIRSNLFVEIDHNLMAEHIMKGFFNCYIVWSP